jgi:hypothetical protein
MINTNIGTVIALLALAALTLAEGWAWLRKESRLFQLSWRLGWLTGGILMINLIWLGLERRHIPPIGLDETLMVLPIVILAIYLKIKADIRSSNAFFSLGLLLATFFFVLGAYGPWSGMPHLGREPLWLWGLLSRWILIAGIAGLYWLALLSALAWWRERSKHPYLQKTLLFETEHVLALSKQLQSSAILIMFPGSLIFTFRDWWGWGNPLSQNVILAIMLLLMLASWWLRFTWPQRRWWTWSLTILAFVAALPALSIIAV